MRIGFLASLLVLTISTVMHADEMRFPLEKHITYKQVLKMEDREEFIEVRSERFIRTMKNKACQDLENDRLFKKRVAKRFGKTTEETVKGESAAACDNPDELFISKYDPLEDSVSAFTIPFYACLATLEDSLVESSTASQLVSFLDQCKSFGYKKAVWMNLGN